MEPFFASIVSILILLASRMAGLAADDTLVASQVMTPGFADWGEWIKTSGTVGVCIWMLVWFQRRNDSQHQELIKITERAIAALEHNDEAGRELAKAIDGLKKVVEDCNRR